MKNRSVGTNFKFTVGPLITGLIGSEPKPENDLNQLVEKKAISTTGHEATRLN